MLCFLRLIKKIKPNTAACEGSNVHDGALPAQLWVPCSQLPLSCFVALHIIAKLLIMQLMHALCLCTASYCTVACTQTNCTAAECSARLQQKHGSIWLYQVRLSSP